MKKFTLLLVFIVVSIGLISQTPQAFKYQAVVRNDLGQVINNQNVSFRISIHDSIAAGPVQYQETHVVMTDAYGHANLNIGNGTPTIGAFSDIDWNDDDKFLELEFDHLGGTAYANMGTIQLLAVPFAMYSEATGDTSRWNKQDDNLYYNHGKIGIGTMTPDYDLDIYSHSTAASRLRLSNLDYSKSLFFSSGSDMFDPSIYFQGGDGLRFMFYDGGYSELMRIQSNGYVGIGTNNPLAKLDVRGNNPDDGVVFRIGNSDLSHELLIFGGRENDPNPFIQWKTGDPLRFSTDEGGWSEKMRIQSDGKVGIGTDTILSKLHIQDENISLKETDIFNEVVTIEDYDAGLGLYSDQGGNYGSFLSMGEIVSGSLSDKWSIYRTTSIANPASQLRISFGSDPLYSLNRTLMAIDSSGRVGIGTTNPSAGLHLKGNQFPNSFMYLQSGDAQDAGFRLYEGSTVKWHIFNNSGLGGLEIYNSNASKITYFADQETGNVGIGTSNPDESALLDLNSNSKGFLLPRMTSSEISDIWDPADGLQVYNTDDGNLYIYVAIDNLWKQISYGTSSLPADCSSPITDPRDGNTYNTVRIGNQCWMAENLAYLPSVSPSDVVSNTTPHYYVYDYEGTSVTAAKATSEYQTYGVLYNWPAAMDGAASSNSVPSGVQGACPTGWHFPSHEEWKILEGAADSQYGYPDPEWDLSGWRGSDVGGNLKEEGTSHWLSPNTGATNSSDFTALPGGYCGGSAWNFIYKGEGGYFSSSTWVNSTRIYIRLFEYDNDKSHFILGGWAGNGLYSGLTVRCIKD